MDLKEWKKMNQDLTVGITTRNGGVSQSPFTALNLGFHVNDCKEDVLENRKIIANEIGIDLAKWVCAEQVHEPFIERVSKLDAGNGALTHSTAVSNADGLYTNEENLLLVSLYADCVPIYFYAPTYQMIGLAHAGWKGTVKQIAQKMIHIWVKKERIPVEDIFVAVGPSIGSCCYEVDDTVINKVKKLTLRSPFPYRDKGNGKYQLDLKKLNALLCLEEGINEEQLAVSQYCTSCRNDLFYSFRKEQGKTGRMMTYIGRINDKK
ncbi:peptidoglycan editing factor PgeF [Bacillus taeanensis]|uniref:Purine nucleoside phosphorylase n=2 Tax=Bacillus taeanensis TaxID=273032 RepID=A0A366XQI2_9BACI|nr:peptidoglycan editing factor PgeF [Bacillus taeanensis]